MAVPDSPLRRTARGFAALIFAVACLAVVGAVAGHLLARGVKANANAKSASAGAATMGAGSRAQPTTNRAAESAAPAGKACLPVTERDAKAKFSSPGGLVQVLYIVTSTGTTGSEAWICRDRDGKLFYQGHRRSAEELAGAPREPFVDLQNSLLLDDVREDGTGRYVATNRDHNGITTYSVSTSQLVVKRENYEAESQSVVAHDP